ncbi:MAG: signal peptide peptidase SppA [Candidatus Dormibacteria bacterium]
MAIAVMAALVLGSSGAVALAVFAGNGFGRPAVAVIEIKGVIGEDTTTSILGDGVTASARSLRKLIQQAADDNSIRAVVLRVDSPGGEVVATQEIWEQVQLLRKKKKVVVSMGSETASGGYYISAGSDRIYANADTLTGSIGVILRLQNLQGLYGKVGIGEEVIKSGPHKDIGDRPLTPEERQMLQSMIDDAYGRFVKVVADGRHMPQDQVRLLADGSVFDGSQAVQNGLVDATGNVDDAIAGAAVLAGISSDYRVITLHESTSIFGSTSTGLLGGALHALGIQSLPVAGGGAMHLEYMLYPPGFFG